MDKIAKFFQELLSLSYTESKGFVKLLMVCIVALALLYLPKYIIRGKPDISEEELRELDSLVNLLQKNTDKKHALELFSFDPNNLSVDSLMLLGFERYLAERIVKYRKKGGVFAERDDLKKIYGLSDEFFKQLYQYIDLPIKVGASGKKNQPDSFDINKIQPDQLEGLPMIGKVLSLRIVRYRDALGGYISEEQFDEVYGLPAEAAVSLKSLVYISKSFNPRLINVNEDSLIVLQQHPYISDVLAEDIVRFREINTIIESEKVLSNFKSIDKSTFEKLILYLEF